MTRPHILILGAGFGGMYTAQQLKSLVDQGEADITIVNETNYFLFTPLLHEVATGSLSPQSVTEPLREIFAGTRVKICQGKVVSIDRERRNVNVHGDAETTDIDSQVTRTISYDFLVIATGATTNYYNIPGAEKYSYPLKTLADAIDIRHRIISSFEKAIMCDDPAMRSQLISFVVVGGGPTGVEVVSELAEFVKGIVNRYYHDTKCRSNEPGSCSPEESKISLIHAGTELLQQFSPKLRKAAADRLQKDSVVLYLNAKVTSVTPDGIVLADGTIIPASTVIWAAGVTPVIPPFENKASTPAPTLVGNRLAVDSNFRLQGDGRIFVLGDVAGYVDSAQASSTVMLPMLAQVATGQARIVALNIKSSIKSSGENTKLASFQYHSKGSMVSVGQWFAIGEIFYFKMSGSITWWIWRTVYLFKFISWKKRLRIVIDWTLNIFYPRDITTR